MALAGTVQSASPGSLGFDANIVITAPIAQQFVAQGFKFCLRYISRGAQPPGDLSPGEAERILDAGLALMPVQHVRVAGWKPTAALGAQDGMQAGKNAGWVGLPPGVNVWCDLEGVAGAATTQAVVDYCNSWFDGVQGAGYLPGLYVGYRCVLDGDQLFQLKFQHYWRSQSQVPNVTKRGYQMIQLFPEIQVNGIKVDLDVTQNDFKAGQVQWLARP